MYTDPETRMRVTGPITFLSKADATSWLAAAETDLRRGDDLDPTGRSMTLSDYADEWLTSKASLRPRTLELYEYLLRVHIKPALGHLPIARISSATVRKWNSELRSGSLSETSAAKAYRLLRQIRQAAVDDRLLRENPCQIKGAAAERITERRIPTLDEVGRLADVIDPRFRAMVLLAAYAGLRKGECFGLARRHLDLAGDPPKLHVERARVDTAERVDVDSRKFEALVESTDDLSLGLHERLARLDRALSMWRAT